MTLHQTSLYLLVGVLTAGLLGGCSSSGQKRTTPPTASPTVLESDGESDLLARAQFDRKQGTARIDYVADDVTAETKPGQNQRRVTVEVRQQKRQKVDLIATSYKAVDTLLDRARARLGDDARVLVATYVDLDDMTQTGSFGRLSGELVSSRLAQQGYASVNLNIREKALAVMQKEGQFMLSRDIDKLSNKYEGDAVLVGTYTVADTEAEADEAVYATLRLVDTKTHETIGAIDYQMPIGPRMERLLSGSTSSYVSDNPF
jgi:hypothetical protein